MTNYPGFGVMLSRLSDYEHNPSEYYGLRIVKASIGEKDICLIFDNGKEIIIKDDGQSCCESRYMTTDDNIENLVGGVLTRIKEKPGNYGTEGEYDDVHETVFLEIGTDKGFVTIVNHNEHNGYYGGFALTIHEK